MIHPLLGFDPHRIVAWGFDHHCLGFRPVVVEPVEPKLARKRAYNREAQKKHREKIRALTKEERRAIQDRVKRDKAAHFAAQLAVK